MKTVFLFHGGKVQHYRIGVYNYLYDYLKKFGYYLTLIYQEYEPGCNHTINIPAIRLSFSMSYMTNLIKSECPHANILFINHRERCFFPFLLYLRATGNKAITWTHGINLQNKKNIMSRMAHHIEHALCHRIILYSEDLKKYLLKSHRAKTYIANNTLNLTGYIPLSGNRKEILLRYNIHTRKNIVYSGKIDLRKRIGDLLEAFKLITNEDFGLIIIGPDVDGILERSYKKNPRIFYLGPLYGKEVLDVLSASDVCCIPGAVGLGIVDSMYCGLPLVTEDVDHGPEIMYFRDGVNGFMVPKGDVVALAEKLSQILKDDDLREKLGRNARAEILTRGHIDNLCAGFLACLKSLES